MVIVNCRGMLVVGLMVSVLIVCMVVLTICVVSSFCG